jgi:fatty acid desaturase
LGEAPREGEDGNIVDEWAVSQIKSSVDYAHNNPVTTFLCGALNYQVTHHLFPTVSQYHYPAIAPIIQDVCREFNVDYKVLPDFVTAFHAHIAHLKTLGERGEAAEVHMG